MSVIISGYKIQDRIYETHRTSIYLSIREKDDKKVIIKTLNDEYPANHDVARIRREYRIAEKLKNIEGVIEVGVTYFPALDEMLAAASGEGCWWNDNRAYVSDVSSLDRAVVVFGDVANFSKYNRSHAWERIKASSYFRAGWGDAYGHLLVATGRAELMLDPIMSVWDCAPFPPIFKEAGGYFGDWQGNSTIHANEAMSTSQKLLPQLLDIFQENS